VDRTEAEFCRRQAERLFALASNCVDLEIRSKIIAWAKEWADQASAKEEAKPDFPKSA
jgi:hypothetical protein